MRDNQPKHRQMRKEQRKLARQRASREGLPAVLIVCEGRETEPNYIQGLMEHLGVNAAAVRIERGGSRTDTVSLVKSAQKIFKDDGGFDLVYVVCDGDSNRLIEARCHAEKTLVNSARQKTSVRIVANTPSIEFWFLLHFEIPSKCNENCRRTFLTIKKTIATYSSKCAPAWIAPASMPRSLRQSCEQRKPPSPIPTFRFSLSS